MQRLWRIILTVAAVGFIAVVAAAQGHKGHEEAGSPSEALPLPKVEPMRIMKDQILPLKVTVTGKVVDVSCFLRHTANSVDHAVCARLCVTQGLPMGILDAKSGQIYLIFAQGHRNPAEPMSKHIGTIIKATGLSYSYGGLKGIEVQKVEVAEGQAENQ